MMTHPNISGDKLVDVVRLIRTLNVGPITFFHLMTRFGTAGEALAALPDLAKRGGRRNPLVAYDREAAEKEVETTLGFGARMILYGAPDYPKLLQHIADPPPVITVMGHAHLWQNKSSVAIVGARNASANGCAFAQRIARELAEAGLTVVSGLARGIDAFAHKGALASGTVGVIAGGIDNIYPPENAVLYGQMKESGAIISEQPFGQAPFAGSFPGRNRIIAGMTLGTLVVEASPKSGSLITARLALENDREVFAVPGSPLDPRSKGCNQLLKQGAIMAESASDIIQGIAHLRSQAAEEAPDSSYTSPAPLAAPGEGELAEARSRIIAKLAVTPVAVDELIEQCNISVSAALTVMLELELAGRLKRERGNQVALVAEFSEEPKKFAS